jgi:hypothetical protein
MSNFYFLVIDPSTNPNLEPRRELTVWPDGERTYHTVWVRKGTPDYFIPQPLVLDPEKIKAAQETHEWTMKKFGYTK